MKILQIITSLQIGGAEKLVAEIAPLLRDRGHEVDVLAFDGADSHFRRMLEKAGIRIISFGEHCGVYNPLFIFKLAALMRGYDVVHTHNTAPQFFAAIAGLFCKAKLVTTEHNTDNRRRHIRGCRILDGLMYGRYQAVICISHRAKETLRAYAGNGLNITTICNGINVSAFAQASPLPRLRSEGKCIIAMVAGFREQKDQDTLIRALSLQPKGTYELWLIGDGTHRAELEALVRGLGLGDDVRFLGVRADVAQLLHTADIVVMSSHYEGLSLSSVEGMAAGKPFVASDVDGLREVVQGAGVLFPHGDAAALAAVIAKLHADKAYAAEIAESCRERAEQYDISKMVDGYDAIYRKLMNP